MVVTKDIDETRQVIRGYDGAGLGFVPTMGYLHEGHLELVRRAKAENARVAVSIYVNPMQFGPAEDLSRYPRDLDRDLALLAAEGVDLVFTPDDEIMYPPDHETVVRVTKVTTFLEGARRPTHFEGVTTIVAKLFNIVQPDRAYFGQKDAQQTVVIRRMVRDLNFNIDIVICPTVREPDGLALSSRNKYLTPEQRAAAPILHQSLRAVESLWLGGTRNGNVLRREAETILSHEPLARVDYVSVANPLTLAEWENDIPAGEGALLSMAVYFDQTRLIDNILLTNSQRT